MSEDKKQTEVASTEKVEQPKETQLDVSKVQPADAKKIAVDIANGVSVELDLETAKKVIAARDSRTKGYKEMEERLKVAEAAARNEAQRAQLLESMKKMDSEAVEAQVSQKYVDRLNKVHNKIVDSALESALLSDDSFIKESKSDALKLLKADHVFELDEAGEKIVSKDSKKEVGEVVAEWLKGKAIFKKAAGTPGTGAKIVPGQKQKVAAAPERINWTNALNGLSDSKKSK